MRKQTAKRGFTITELVIVIVVIAILAAVLIPTFASLIKKANQSADVQLTKNLNTILAMDEAENGKATEFETVLHAFQENGYLLANLNPTAKGCYLAWESETNQMLLVELTDKAPNYKVLFSAKKDYGEPDDSWYFAVKDQAAKDAVKAALPPVNVEMTILDTTALNTEINKGGTVHIDGSLVVDDNNTIKLDNASAVTTIDLGSNKVSGGSKNAAIEAIPFQVTAGTLNLKNGTISAVGTFINSDGVEQNAAIWAKPGSVMNVEGTTISMNKAASSFILYNDAEGKVKDVKIDAPASNNAINVSDESDMVVENCNIDVEYIAVQATYGAKVTIKGGTYHSSLSNLLCVNAEAASIIVEDGTFNCDSPSKTFKFYNYIGNKIVLKGGTFNGVAFADLSEPVLRNMCNISNVAANQQVKITKVGNTWELEVVAK